MSNVIDITARKAKVLPAADTEMVWQCECDSQVFWLHVGGGVRCAGCNQIHDTVIWGEVNVAP